MDPVLGGEVAERGQRADVVVDLVGGLRLPGRNSGVEALGGFEGMVLALGIWISVRIDFRLGVDRHEQGIERVRHLAGPITLAPTNRATGSWNPRLQVIPRPGVTSGR